MHVRYVEIAHCLESCRLETICAVKHELLQCPWLETLGQGLELFQSLFLLWLLGFQFWFLIVPATLPQNHSSKVALGQKEISMPDISPSC